ncbi:MAG: hypothetical protein WC123_06590 [Bacilli bacterium]
MIPKQCHLWQKEKIDSSDFNFEEIKTYFESSHEWRHLKRCKQCGQLYISDNIEWVDYFDGNDEVNTQLVPVSEEELKQYDFEKMSSCEILLLLPRIDWGPKNDLEWIGK